MSYAPISPEFPAVVLFAQHFRGDEFSARLEVLLAFVRSPINTGRA